MDLARRFRVSTRVAVDRRLVAVMMMVFSFATAAIAAPLLTECLPKLPATLASTLKSNSISTATPIQAAALSRAGNGESLLLHAATGSGKSLTICLSACAEYVTRAEANLEAIRRCEPVDLVLSPLNASASSLVTFANRYFGDVASDLEVFGDRPIALHVDRSGFGEGHVNDGARQRRTGHTPMCPQGHRLDYQTVRPQGGRPPA